MKDNINKQQSTKNHGEFQSNCSVDIKKNMQLFVEKHETTSLYVFGDQLTK